jgi:SAM-dependent methyltransferase
MLVTQNSNQSEVDRKLAKSLTADTPELIPYLPYLLKDLWELGLSPEDMQSLIEENLPSPSRLNVIDFGCGKGAVPIHLARTLGCHVKGIDLMPEFIEEAQFQAIANGVEELCDFVIEDINHAVLVERNYDVAILDAIGDVIGTPAETIRMVRHAVKENGYLLINDAFKLEAEPSVASESSESSRQILKESRITKGPVVKGAIAIEIPIEKLDSPFLTYDEWVALFEYEGLEVVEDLLTDAHAFFEFNQHQVGLIKVRVEELKRLHPDKTALFDGFLKHKEEALSQEEPLQGITWLLRKKQFIPSRYL